MKNQKKRGNCQVLYIVKRAITGFFIKDNPLKKHIENELLNFCNEAKMKKEMVCTNCGYHGKVKKIYKGSDLMEICLWVCFILPGFIYSMWRTFTKYEGCPQCGAANMIPVDSPFGRKLAEENKKTVKDQNIITDDISKKSNEKEINDKKKVITISFVLSWIFGALFLLSGVTLIFTKPLIGLMMLVMAAALLPPIVNKFENKFNTKITRNIKTFVLLACFFVIAVIGSIEGEIRRTKQEKIEKESIVLKPALKNSHITSTSSNTVLKELSPDTHSTSLKVVCNKFKVHATLKDSKLTFSLDTDLPDNTKVMVSVCRFYWKRGSSEAYVTNYYETKSTVGALRYLSMVKLDDDRWGLDLQKKQKLLAKRGEPFEISKISDDLELDMTVPINQDNPAFGHRNKNLVGPMVTDSGSLRVISVEKKFKAPLLQQKIFLTTLLRQIASER
jgi:hypothetical protein